MFTNKQKTRVMNAVSGYGFYEPKQIKFQSPKDFNDLDHRIGRIKTLVREISNIQNHKYITQMTMKQSLVNEEVQDEILDSFDTLGSIKKVLVSEMINSLLHYQREVEFTSQEVYVNYLNENLFDTNTEYYPIIDRIRNYW